MFLLEPILLEERKSLRLAGSSSWWLETFRGMRSEGGLTIGERMKREGRAWISRLFSFCLSFCLFLLFFFDFFFFLRFLFFLLFYFGEDEELEEEEEEEDEDEDGDLEIIAFGDKDKFEGRIFSLMGSVSRSPDSSLIGSDVSSSS